MVNNAPQVTIVVVVETFASDQDLDHLVEGMDHRALHDTLGLGWDAEGNPIQEEIIVVGWERKT